MAIQEVAFNILWDTLKKYISIDRLVEAMTIIPRDIFGLKDAVVAKGSKASLTVFTTDGNHTLTKDNVKSCGVNDPFLDKKLSGKVLAVINNDHIHLNK